MVKKFLKKIGNHIKNVLTIKESPKEIARGFTLGTAIAVLPTFGLGAFIGLGIILIFKKISKISMMTAFAVWNAIVLVPVYSLSYVIGDLILKDTINTNFQFILNEELYIYSIKFITGDIIIATMFSIISYVIIYKLAKRYQDKYKKYIADPIEKKLIYPIEELI